MKSRIRVIFKDWNLVRKMFYLTQDLTRFDVRKMRSRIICDQDSVHGRKIRRSFNILKFFFANLKQIMIYEIVHPAREKTNSNVWNCNTYLGKRIIHHCRAVCFGNSIQICHTINTLIQGPSAYFFQLYEQWLFLFDFGDMCNN